MISTSDGEAKMRGLRLPNDIAVLRSGFHLGILRWRYQTTVRHSD